MIRAEDAVLVRLMRSMKASSPAPLTSRCVARWCERGRRRRPPDGGRAWRSRPDVAVGGDREPVDVSDAQPQVDGRVRNVRPCSLPLTPCRRASSPGPTGPAHWCPENVGVVGGPRPRGGSARLVRRSRPAARPVCRSDPTLPAASIQSALVGEPSRRRESCSVGERRPHPLVGDEDQRGEHQEQADDGAGSIRQDSSHVHLLG